MTIRNDKGQSGRNSRVYIDQAKKYNDIEDRYIQKMKQSVRSKTNRNQYKTKSQSYGTKEQMKKNESLDKELIKRIEQDLKLYDLRNQNM